MLIAEVVTWEKEFRCFILNRKLQTFSVYLRHGELQREQSFTHSLREAQELVDFLERFLADPRVILPMAAVVDVGVIAGRGWAVVEQNAAWGSGIYGCEPTQVLEVLRYAVIPESC